jgi:hypothetical protein
MMFVIPDAFLGGSAPLLQEIYLDGIRFPNLPNLLSSTSDLVELTLKYIPMTGYIPPDVMATCLSGLTKLQSLTIAFYPTDQRPPPSTHAVLLSLDDLQLDGPHGYIEDLLDQLDAPLLKSGELQFNDDGPSTIPRGFPSSSIEPKRSGCLVKSWCTSSTTPSSPIFIHRSVPQSLPCRFRSLGYLHRLRLWSKCAVSGRPLSLM